MHFHSERLLAAGRRLLGEGEPAHRQCDDETGEDVETAFHETRLSSRHCSASGPGTQLLSLRRLDEEALKRLNDSLRCFLGGVVARLEWAARYLGCSLAPHRQDVAAIESAHAATASP